MNWVYLFGGILKFFKRQSKLSEFEVFEIKMLAQIQSYIEENERLLQSPFLPPTMREAVIADTESYQQLIRDYHRKKEARIKENRRITKKWSWIFGIVSIGVMTAFW